MVYLRNRLGGLPTARGGLLHASAAPGWRPRSAPRQAIEQYDGAPRREGCAAHPDRLLPASSNYADLAENTRKVFRAELPQRLAGYAGQARPVWTACSTGKYARSASANSAPVAVGDGVTPVAAEGAAADADTRRRLAALVFVALHHVEHAPDHRAVEAARHDLVHRAGRPR